MHQALNIYILDSRGTGYHKSGLYNFCFVVILKHTFSWKHKGQMITMVTEPVCGIDIFDAITMGYCVFLFFLRAYSRSLKKLTLLAVD